MHEIVVYELWNHRADELGGVSNLSSDLLSTKLAHTCLGESSSVWVKSIWLNFLRCKIETNL